MTFDPWTFGVQVWGAVTTTVTVWQAVAVARQYLQEDGADVTCQPAFRDECVLLHSLL